MSLHCLSSQALKRTRLRSPARETAEQALRDDGCEELRSETVNVQEQCVECWYEAKNRRMLRLQSPRKGEGDIELD